MKKFLFCLGSFATVFGGVAIGVRASPTMGGIAFHQLIFPLLFTGAGISFSYFSARLIGEDRARGKYKTQRELPSGIYTVERGDKRFVIFARNISMPGEGEELYHLDTPIGDDVFAVKAPREGDSVSIEPYRGDAEVAPV